MTELERIKKEHREMKNILTLLVENSRHLLAINKVAGHRQTASGAWVADPYTEAYDEARAILLRTGDV